MIYKLAPIKDDFLEKVYTAAMSDLNKFYEIGWTYGLPKVIIVNDRKEIDLLRGRKSEPWEIGWAEWKSIYILSKENFEKESSHEYSDETYAATVKHELSHCFYHVLSSFGRKPVWLNEGVAIHVSGQNKFKKRPVEFTKFLGFFSKGGSGVYSEAGFAVEILIKKYGKKKLFGLIKRLEEVNSEKEFNTLFKSIYNFEPTYENFNSLLNKTE